MIATVTLLLCLQDACEDRSWQAYDVPALYCAGLWQSDAVRFLDVGALINAGYTVRNVECEVVG